MTDVMADQIVREEKDPWTAMQRRMRPPDRRKFERDVEACSGSIAALEGEMKSLNLRGDDSIQAELRSIRTEKEATIARRKKTDTDLRAVNQAISKQMDSLTKIQSNLAYKDEARINSAIRRMEDQLKSNNFRLSEEKKIVAEIDRLRRSKKALVQYTALKQEIDSMRENQRRMRDQRDCLYKEVTVFKTREEEIKRRTASNKLRSEELKKELDDLYEKKRQIHAEFRRQEREFYSMREEVRRRRREEERRAQDEQYEQDLAEYEASREPYEDEKHHCATLIAYLQRFLASSEPESASTFQGSENSPSGPSLELENDGMYILRKKTDDDMYGGMVRPKTNKRSKRDKRKAVARSIVHNPEVFGDFAKLNLEAPLTLADVPQVLQQLQEKKVFYDNLPAPVQPSIIIVPGQGDHSGSAGAPSVAESAICESMPSTPEVQLDNAAPSFPRGEHSETLRRLSHDSGACELEEQVSLDDSLLPGDPSLSSCSLGDPSFTGSLRDPSLSCNLDALSTGDALSVHGVSQTDLDNNLSLQGAGTGPHISVPPVSVKGVGEAGNTWDNGCTTSQISQEGSCSSTSSNSTSTSDQTVVSQLDIPEHELLHEQSETLGRMQTAL